MTLCLLTELNRHIQELRLRHKSIRQRGYQTSTGRIPEGQTLAPTWYEAPSKECFNRTPLR